MQEVFENIIEKLEELNTIDCQMKTVTCRKWDYGTIVKAIEIVKQEAEKFAPDTNVGSNGWIPCSVELPPQPAENPTFDNKPLELYLVSVNHADYPIRAFWNGKFFTDGWSKVDVNAWQPLPHPYQTKGE